ncbi:MAG: hypothetical protein HUJ68_07415 [Clostridia bacterium]|nr:hypothetical protein [Clostridia bacterium]
MSVIDNFFEDLTKITEGEETEGQYIHPFARLFSPEALSLEKDFSIRKYMDLYDLSREEAENYFEICVDENKV